MNAQSQLQDLMADYNNQADEKINSQNYNI